MRGPSGADDAVCEELDGDGFDEKDESDDEHPAQELPDCDEDLLDRREEEPDRAECPLNLPELELDWHFEELLKLPVELQGCAKDAADRAGELHDVDDECGMAKNGWGRAITRFALGPTHHRAQVVRDERGNKLTQRSFTSQI